MFVQVIKGHVGAADELQASWQRWVRELAPTAPGWLGSTAGVTADGTAVMIARFESAELARRSSERPEQHQWWMETAKLFGGDVTFQDSGEVAAFGGTGADRAGFVQIVQGRHAQLEDARHLLAEIEEPLRDFRPDVISGVLCLHDDGGFTQAVYFTSEAEARHGQQHQPPPKVKALLEDEETSARNVTSYNLKDPWLHSAG